MSTCCELTAKVRNISGTNNQITETISERRSNILDKANKLKDMLYFVAEGVSLGADLNENHLIILAELACGIKYDLMCLFPLNDEKQYYLNDIYENFDLRKQVKLVNYADDLADEKK